MTVRLLAQEPAAAPSALYSNSVLAPGEEILIRVPDLEEIDNRTARIDPAGQIHLPYLSNLRLSGLTLPQAETVVRDQLRRVLRDPVVTLSVTKPRERLITVTGAVNSPGTREVQNPKLLLAALAEAGGLRSDAGPLIHITRPRDSGPIPLPGGRLDASGAFYTASVEAGALLRGENPGENIPVFAHDVIAASPAEFVYVLGEVTRPGAYDLTEGATLVLNAIARAGGPTRNAALSRIRVLRRGRASLPSSEFSFDFGKLIRGKAPNFSLEGRDIVYIPTNKGKLVTARAIEALIGTGSGIAVFRSTR